MTVTHGTLLACFQVTSSCRHNQVAQLANSAVQLQYQSVVQVLDSGLVDATRWKTVFPSVR